MNTISTPAIAGSLLRILALVSLSVVACSSPGSGGSGVLPSPCVANPNLPGCLLPGGDATSDSTGTGDVATTDTSQGDTVVLTDTAQGDGSVTTGCTLGATRCVGNGVETCLNDTWTPATTCGAAEQCLGGACVPAVCTPDCSGKQCGDNGCGASCGSCSSGETCDTSGQCESTCVADCAGKQCGLDGCGGTCGDCGSGMACNDTYQCESTTCQPTCGECGPDGCGSICGNCPTGWQCQGNTCVESTCTPQCAGKQCGDDGCGSTCGSCVTGDQCVAGVCTTGTVGCGGVSFEGCCSGNNVLTWCEADTVETIDCSQEPGRSCAWVTTSGFFDCTVAPEEPPIGTDYLCGGETCSATCADVGCGYECGELCNVCPGGQTCGENKTCAACACGVDQICGTDPCGNDCGTGCPTSYACNGGTECVYDACAAGLGYEGCCDGTFTYYCDNDGTPKGGDCENSCGWSADGFYDCDQTGPDPSGTYPIACPGLIP